MALAWGLGAQFVQAIGFPLAHLTAKPGHGILQFVVELGADLIDQVFLFTVHIGGDEGSPSPLPGPAPARPAGQLPPLKQKCLREERLHPKAAPESPEHCTSPFLRRWAGWNHRTVRPAQQTGPACPGVPGYRGAAPLGSSACRAACSAVKGSTNVTASNDVLNFFV